MASSAHDQPWPATLTLGSDGRITSWSRGAQALFGLSAARACGRRLRSLLVRPEDRSIVDELFGSVLAGRSWSGALPLLDADGRAHPVECGWQPIQDRRGRPGALIVVTDRGDGPAEPPADAPLGTAHAALDAISQFHEHAAAVAMMRRVQLLTDANTMIGSTLDMATTARELMDVAVPRFADSASLVVLESVAADYELPDGRPVGAGTVLRRLAAAPYRREKSDVFPIGGTLSYAHGTAFAQALTTGRSRTLTALDPETAQKVTAGLGDEVAAAITGRSLLIVPLKARGAVLGLAIFIRSGSRRPFSPGEAVLGEELAARAALCIDNARLYSHERQTALMLQRALLPADAGYHAGIDIAHRYLPASDLTGVGGDWYDVIGLGGGRVALVVGDVMGHGVRAAAVMGQLRTATRTLAALDLQPAEVLRHLDELMEHLGGSMTAAHFATCIVAVYDPTERMCRIARAGHVPPLAVWPDGRTEMLDIPAGVPLGVGGHTFESRDIPMPDGSLLVLCTDGLVESRAPGRDIDDGLRDLAEGVKDPTMALEAIADGLIAGLRGDRTLDDAALLIARVRGIPTSSTAEWTVAPEPPAVALSRRTVRATLGGWGLQQLGDTAELLTSELVTNALLYTEGPISVRLMRDRTLLCEVYDGSETVPRLRVAADDDVGGRGLRLVKELSNRWGTRRTTTGKTVWFELRLEPQADF
ncbi:MAG TPA: SpoIIE family protein phosphatase [Actinocrinis sp.]|uniref:ATP-binding SpoIIE family protein phosphatase n=1 Tax=Actinocrinis sp. TaxID=1920516 RepID=UPI002DDD65A1|nr:SpoIIE family protein phosphatase [Actinocrinis sp.]HEV3169703.1 SpoIIE family protein phosphatase [Actinocrinis sp.]